MGNKQNFLSASLAGKLSYWLSVLLLLSVATAVTLVLVLGILSFDDTWWDITVPILIVVTLVSLVSGLIALFKNKDRSGSVYFAVSVCVLAILFLLLHSLFISD